MSRKSLQNLVIAVLLVLVCTPTPSFALDPPVFNHLTNLTNYLVSPSRVTTDTSGNIYVVDENTKSVTVLDPAGAQLFIIGGNDVPKSIAVDLQKRIIVGYRNDDQPGYVAMYDSSGQFLRYLGSGLGEFTLPGDIAVSYSTGKIYVLDSIQNGVKVYDSAGNNVLNGQGNPLYFGGFGQYDYIYSTTPNNGKFDFPSGIAVDDIRQEVLVSDQNNYRIQIFDMDGNFKSFFGQYTKERAFGAPVPGDFQGKFSRIGGLTVDKQGRIYVADRYQCLIQILDRAGNYLTFIGSYGMGTEQLNIPTDVTIDNQKRLIITDWNNNRLSIFQVDSGPALNNLAPDAPVQVSPAHATQLNTTTPTMTVYNALDPNGDTLNYRFEIDTSSSFSNPVSFVSAQGATYTSGTSPALADHMVYFWRVRAEEAATTDLFSSPWSSTRSFYLNAVNRAPSSPSGLTPAAGSTVKKSTSLGWNASTDPDLYDTITYVVEISEQANFSTILLSRNGVAGTGVRIDSFNQYTKLKSNQQYYWRVTAVDNHGAASAASATGSFVFKQIMLQISSTPRDAKVYLDGNYSYLGSLKGSTGASPLEIIDIDAGRHVIRIEKAGYFGYYTSVQVVDGETKTVNAELIESEVGTRPLTRNLSDESGIVIGEGTPAIVSAKPFMVDWNNDGRKDLLVGDDTGKVYLFENTSSDASPVYQLSQNYAGGIVLNASAKAAPFVVDWDNDGMKDLLVGGGDGTVRLYLNIGSDGAPTFGGFTNLAANGSAIQVGGSAVPTVVDWNNDDKKDLLIGENVGTVRLFVNTGTDAAPLFNDAGAVLQGVNIQAGSADLTVTADAAPLAIDWNLDGRKDLVVGGAAGFSIFLNSGTDSVPSFTTASTGYITGAGIAPLVLDYNDDGYSDLLAGMGNGHVSYYQFKADEPPAPAAPAKKKKKEKGAKKMFKKLFRW